MIPAKVRKLYHTKRLGEIISIFENVPEEYTMSTGHVRFFYDKMLFLHERYLYLTRELHNRKYAISHTNPSEIFILDMPSFSMGHYSPTKKHVMINIDRISQRLHQRPDWYRYYGKIQPPEFFIERYNQQLLFDTLI
jgi:deoxyribonuclease (pyrimidine dimer)